MERTSFSQVALQLPPGLSYICEGPLPFCRVWRHASTPGVALHAVQRTAAHSLDTCVVFRTDKIPMVILLKPRSRSEDV